MNSIQEIAGQLVFRDNYILVGHAAPDGDCIGSMLALYWGLNILKKQVQMCSGDSFPPIYSYLKGFNEVKKPGEIKIPEKGFNVVYLDCSDENRVDEEAAQVLSVRACAINIDHHLTNELFGDYNYVNPSAAATAEILYELFMHMGIDITPEMAAALYAGIVKDTGKFLNSNTTSTSLRIAADLLEKGADVNMARINLFETKPREEILLLQQALQYIGFSSDGRIAWMMLPYEKIVAIGALDLHPEGIIDYTRMIEGVEIGLLFREMQPGEVKVGFRSRGNIDVAAIAQRFGGGGHRMAAGARIKGSLEEARDKVVSVIEGVIS